MTATELERLAVLESEVSTIKDSTARIEQKLDSAITCKADKTEVQDLRKMLWGVIIGVAAFAVTTLVGVVLLRIGLK